MLQWGAHCRRDFVRAAGAFVNVVSTGRLNLMRFGAGHIQYSHCYCPPTIDTLHVVLITVLQIAAQTNTQYCRPDSVPSNVGSQLQTTHAGWVNIVYKTSYICQCIDNRSTLCLGQKQIETCKHTKHRSPTSISRRKNAMVSVAQTHTH